ncbi:MAG: hypothetical protein FJ086_13035 [Deltaproteobacteria bacterium]|nr:hypothetical protein [Deltaproteobacteria bacterium]
MHPYFAATALSLFLLPAAAFGWGFAGHRKLASKLAEPLPTGCLKSWLAAQASKVTFQDQACDPDRWRETDTAEGARHFLDIDWASPPSSYPREWEAIQQRFGQYAEKNGTVPFRVEEYRNRLVQAFQSGDSAAAATAVAHLSHYATDAFSPYHDTKDSNPKLNNVDSVGAHARYESDMLGGASNMTALLTKAATYYGTVGAPVLPGQVFDVVLVGNPLAAEVTAAYRSGNGQVAALYSATSDLTARRFGDALTFTASLVASAWVEAGKPNLTGMPSGCSKNVPQGEIVLRGYPLPPPVPAQPDAGTPAVEDAGQPAEPDAGSGEPEVEEPPPGEAPPPESCGCGGETAAAVLLPITLLGRLRRRRVR